MAWIAYGISTLDNGWNLAWHVCWGALVGLGVFNAFTGYLEASREKAEDQW